jgi:hypothetical protein
MNEFIYKLNFLNLIKGSKFIETIRDLEPKRKISPISIWKAYNIGRNTSANAVLIFSSLIHSLRDLYPNLEIIRLIIALYKQKLQEIIIPKTFKYHYNHYFECLTVQTKEEDAKLANSEEYKGYIEYFWKLFQWIKIEFANGHAFDNLGDYYYDDFEISLLENIGIVNDNIKSMDLNLIYKENKIIDVENNDEKVTIKSNDDKFNINIDENNNLNVVKDKTIKRNIQNIRFKSVDDSYLVDHQLIKSNLCFNQYFSMKIDELDNELFYNKFDLIFKKIFYYDTPILISINDIYHLDKPPPSQLSSNIQSNL